jgi:hypothetical protein
VRPGLFLTNVKAHSRHQGRIKQAMAAAPFAHPSKDVTLVFITGGCGRVSPGQHEFVHNAIIAGAEYVLAKSIENVQRARLRNSRSPLHRLSIHAVRTILQRENKHFRIQRIIRGSLGHHLATPAES